MTLTDYAELRHLRKITKELPVTRDGYKVGPGCIVWYVNIRGEVCSHTVVTAADGWHSFKPGADTCPFPGEGNNDDEMFHEVSTSYYHKSAAEAAQKEMSK